jgi:hypothetical protein
VQTAPDGTEIVSVVVEIKLEDFWLIAEIIQGRPRPLYAEPELIPVRTAALNACRRRGDESGEERVSELELSGTLNLNQYETMMDIVDHYSVDASTPAPKLVANREQ